MDTRAFYQEELATNLAEQAGLKKRDTRFSVLRGMLTVAVFVLIYFAIVQRLPFLWTLASLLIVVFAWILRFHIKLRSRLEHVDRKLGVIRTELNYLGHDLSALDEGSAFRNEDHPYSTDLDGVLPQRQQDGHVISIRVVIDKHWPRPASRQRSASRHTSAGPTISFL